MGDWSIKDLLPRRSSRSSRRGERSQINRYNHPVPSSVQSLPRQKELFETQGATACDQNHPEERIGLPEAEELDLVETLHEGEAPVGRHKAGRRPSSEGEGAREGE